MKLAIWMNMPSHHQSGLFDALRRMGGDVRVTYYQGVTQRRREQGWDTPSTLPEGERILPADLWALAALEDWRERVHIVPGYGSAFTRRLVVELSRQRVSWLHWSERDRPGLSWLATYPIKAWYARMVNRHALAALAIGDGAREDFVRWGIDPSKIRFLPYSGVLPPETGETDQCVSTFLRASQPVFMQIGILNRAKGVDLLIEAFASVVASNMKARLVLVGKDESRGAFAKLIRARNLTELVLLRGPVPARSLGSILRAADVVVLATRFDGWGMALAEGAGYGKALIASDACGAAVHLIQEGQNGFRVPSNDVHALTARMLQYANCPQLAARHGARSRVIYQEFTPERNAERLLTYVSELMPRMVSGVTRRG